MNRYEATIHRAAFGLAAIALSATTLGLTVILPASLASDRYAAGMLAASAVPAPREIAIVPSRIHVVANCDENVAFQPDRDPLPSDDRSS
jgi:hypothetical protein